MAHRFVKGMTVEKDGDAWCFTLTNFENLQTCPAVFINASDTNMDTIYESLKEMLNHLEGEKIEGEK